MFDSKTDYSIEPPQAFGTHISVAIGKLNSDAFPEVLVATHGTVTTLLNEEMGALRPARPIQMYVNVPSVAAEDFDRDGWRDIAITLDDDKAAVLYNRGDAVFFRADGTVASERLETAQSPWLLAVGDFNGDGWPDVATQNADSVSVILNSSYGFAPRVDYPLGQKGGNAIVAADFDGDGTLDLAVANAGDQYHNFYSVGVLLNEGDGSFATRVEYYPHGAPEGIAAADFNGDGRTDLVVGLASGVAVLMNTGGGTFASDARYETANDLTWSVAAADVNGDGWPDIAAAGGFGSTVSVLLNQGDGTFTPPLEFATGACPWTVTMGDLNGDGREDLVVGNACDNSVSIFLNRCN